MRFFFIWLVCIMTAASAVPRLAIVRSTDQDPLPAFCDLLTAELSKSPEVCELVERDELHRLEQEAEVQRLGPGERPLALARLAKADGLVLVSPETKNVKQPRLAMRLVDCSTGLISQAHLLHAEPKDLPGAVELSAASLRFASPRLARGGAGILPQVVSLLGLSSGLQLNDPLTIPLNFALTSELSAQPGVLVSERWRLQDVVFERSLVASGLPPLSTGALLVDGSFVRKDNGMVVNLRLRSREKDGGETATLEIASHVPTVIAKEVAAEISRRSGIGKLVPYDPSVEARHYAQLGKWSFARQLSVEAAQAYEAAIALGDASPESRVGRIRAYADMILPRAGVESYWPARHDVHGLDRLPEAEFKVAVTAAVRITRDLHELVTNNWPGFDASSIDRKKRYYLIRGVEDLGEAVLQGICVRGGQRAFEREARELRQHCRHLVAADAEKKRLGFADCNIHVGYICETPEEAIAIWRAMLDPGKLALEGDSPGNSIRWDLWAISRKPVRPEPVVAWPGTDPERAGEVWRAFVKELALSSNPLNRIDAMALEYQGTLDPMRRRGIVSRYIDFLESNFDWLRTEEGQASFVAFGAHWLGEADASLLREACPRFVRLFARLFGEADWITDDSMHPCTMFLGSLETGSAEGDVLLSEAEKLLICLDRYSQRMTTHARWEKAEQQKIRMKLKEIRTRIVTMFPKLAEIAMKPHPPADGAVQMRSWRPAADNERGSLIDGGHLRWDGQRLLVPLKGPWMCSLDPATLRADTFAFPERHSKYWSMDVCDGHMMVSAGGLFRSDYRREPGRWTPVEFPEAGGKEPLDWKVVVQKGDFYLATPAAAKSSRVHGQGLLGRYADGRVEWKIASNRKPELHPFDSKKPRGFEHLVRSVPGGANLAVVSTLELMPTREVIDLGSGECLAELYVLGFIQRSGDKDLEWYASKGVCMHILALDPNERKPWLLFRDPNPANTQSPLRQGWEKVTPVFNSSRPEFRGDFIAPVFHADRLWMLKWEPDDMANIHGPNDLRLVCADPVSKKAVVVPLREAEGWSPTGNRRWTVEPGSVTATPHGLFFAAGEENSEEVESSVLCYLRWQDINDWLAAKHPDF
jgi:hypothetical protein